MSFCQYMFFAKLVSLLECTWVFFESVFLINLNCLHCTSHSVSYFLHSALFLSFIHRCGHHTSNLFIALYGMHPPNQPLLSPADDAMLPPNSPNRSEPGYHNQQLGDLWEHARLHPRSRGVEVAHGARVDPSRGLEYPIDLLCLQDTDPRTKLLSHPVLFHPLCQVLAEFFQSENTLQLWEIFLNYFMNSFSSVFFFLSLWSFC